MKRHASSSTECERNRCRSQRSRALTRRRVFAGALGAAGASVLGAGLSRSGSEIAEMISVAAQADNSLCAPLILPSTNGLLSVELVAEDDPTRDDGVAYFGGGVKCPPGGPGFSGRIPGPTLEVKPGDRLKINLANRLDEGTNLHVHGLHVTPLGNGDNVFVHVEKDEEFDFEYDIPCDHPTGIFWYHPHFHENALTQVENGLAGAILIVEPDEDLDVKDRLISLGQRYPGPPVAETHLLVFQKVSPLSDQIVVNGRENPEITIGKGQQQRWQLLNASARNFVNFSVKDHKLRRVAFDGNWISDYEALDPVEVLALGPAERAEVLIDAFADEVDDTFEVWSYRTMSRVRPIFDADLAAVPPPAGLTTETLATLRVVAPAPATPAPATPGAPPAGTPVTMMAPDDQQLCDDEREPCGNAASDPDHTIQFDTTMTIDGKHFSEGRVDQTVKYGAAETWQIESLTPANAGWHPFHLHVNDFDVLDTSDDRLEKAQYQDTIPVPPGGWVKFCSRFEDYAGKFVYHCHFLDHEDSGMMAVVEVVQAVSIVAGAIDQPELSVLPGTTVSWTNVQSTAGDTTSYTIAAADGSFNSGLLGPGQSYAYTFETPGATPYCCLPDGPGAPATCPDGLGGEVKVEAERTVDITADDEPGTIRFHPPTLCFPPITAGTTVTWTNRDNVPHSVTAAGVFDSGPIAPNGTFEHTFLMPGELDYAGEVAAARTPKIDVRPPRPAFTVWIEPNGIAHAQQIPYPGEEPDPDIYVPKDTLVIWTNRSGVWRNIAEDVTGEPAYDSDRLEFEKAPEDPDPPPEPGEPDKPLIPGQRFSHRFRDLGIFDYRSVAESVADPKFEARVYVVTQVEIVDFAFVPATVEVPVGTPVSWVNRGVETHTVTAVEAAYGGVPAYSSEALESGKRFTKSFDTPGTYTYRCAIHGDMVGTVIVR